jgi:hypothetical protein
MVTRSKPAARMAFRYSSRRSAPAMQAAYRSASFRAFAESGRFRTMSLTTIRPPAFRVRWISRKTFVLSGERLITQLEIAASTVPVSTGSFSM